MTVFSLHDSVSKYFHYVNPVQLKFPAEKSANCQRQRPGEKAGHFSRVENPSYQRSGSRGRVQQPVQPHVGFLQGFRVLDLFAGSGAMGIEALSRGAMAAVFVDNSPQAIRVIRQNIENCGFSEQATIFQKDVWGCWPFLEDFGPFDIVFLDPPYGKGLVSKALHAIRGKNLLKPGGIVCAETSVEETLEEGFRPLVVVKTCRYGSTRVHFFKISDEGAESE